MDSVSIHFFNRFHLSYAHGFTIWLTSFLIKLSNYSHLAVLTGREFCLARHSEVVAQILWYVWAWPVG